MLAHVLALVLASAQEGSARVQDGEATTTLNLVSFTADTVRLGKKGLFTSVEALYRAADGDRLDLRLAFRGPGAVPRDRVRTLAASVRARGTRVTGADNGCRVALTRATRTELAGSAYCARPAGGDPVTITFEAKGPGR
jgi:hypothetical protein